MQDDNEFNCCQMEVSQAMFASGDVVTCCCQPRGLPNLETSRSFAWQVNTIRDEPKS